MNWFREIGRRFWALIHRSQFDSDLQEEMRLHRELCEREAMERGLSPQEAHYAVQRRFGNDLLLRDRRRDMWRWIWRENLTGDLVSSMRRIRRHPRNFLYPVLTLAVGIGSTIGILNVAYQALHSGLPYRHPDRIAVAGSELQPIGNPTDLMRAGLGIDDST